MQKQQQKTIFCWFPQDVIKLKCLSFPFDGEGGIVSRQLLTQAAVGCDVPLCHQFVALPCSLLGALQNGVLLRTWKASLELLHSMGELQCSGHNWDLKTSIQRNQSNRKQL